MVSGPRGAGTVDAAWHVVKDLNIEAASATNQLQKTVVNLVLDQAGNHGAAVHNVVKVTWLYFVYCFCYFLVPLKQRNEGYVAAVCEHLFYYLGIEHWPVKPPDFGVSRNTEISIFVLSLLNISSTLTYNVAITHASWSKRLDYSTKA